MAGALLSKEIRHKYMGGLSRHGEAHYVQRVSKNHGRSCLRGRYYGKNHDRSKYRSKKDIECYYCHEQGHLKKDYYAWKKDKGKGKEKPSSAREKLAIEDKPKSSVTITELNVVTHTKVHDQDICFLDSLLPT